MMKHPGFDQMVALAERLRLELDSSDRKNLVGSQIIPDKFRTCAVPTPRPGTARGRALVKMSGTHFIAKRFSNSSCDSLAPSSVSATDLAFDAGFEM